LEHTHCVQRQARRARRGPLAWRLFHVLPASEQLNDLSDNRIAGITPRRTMIPPRNPFPLGRIEASELRSNQGATMFRVIAKYAPAVAALGMLTSVSFGVNALETERSAELPTVTVRYADLNLNTSAGAEELY